MLCLASGINGHRMVSRARHAKKVSHAANRQNQGVVGYVPLRQNGMALIVHNRTDNELAVGTVEVEHLPLLKFEMMPARLSDVLELVRMRIHTARCHFMQQRLPKVRSSAIDQDNLSVALLAELVAQTSDQLKTTCTTPPPRRCDVAGYERMIGVLARDGS